MESLTLIDLDKIKKAQQQIKTNLQQEVAQLHQATKAMQQKLQSDFHTTMQQLELRIMQMTMKMIQTLGKSCNASMNSQSECSEWMIKLFQTTMDQNSKYLLQAVSK